MGAAGSGFKIMDPLGTAGGAILGTYLINGPMSSTSYASIGSVIVGLIIPRFSKSSVVEAVGNGLVAAGAISIMQNANVISGIPMRNIASPRRRMGALPISSVAGTGSQLNISQRNAQNTVRAASRQGRTVLNGVPSEKVMTPRRRTMAGFCDATI